MAHEAAWRCFHCGDLFTNANHAAAHFGIDELQAPGCVAVLRYGESHLLSRIRDLEEELARYRAEDSDLIRWYGAKTAQHADALTAAEQKGYDRGLKDADRTTLMRVIASYTAPGDVNVKPEHEAIVAEAQNYI